MIQKNYDDIISANVGEDTRSKTKDLGRIIDYHKQTGEFVLENGGIIAGLVYLMVSSEFDKILTKE